MALTDEQNLSHMKEVLLRGTSVLDQLNIPYVLVGGTLLGIIRENNLLGHDGDVDVDVLVEDVGDIDEFLKKINSVSDTKANFHNQYFTIQYDFGGNSTNFDIFIVFNKDGKRFRHFWSKESDNFEDAPCLVWPEEFYYKDKWEDVEFLDRKFKVPARPEEYLETMYGEDWRTPKKQWSWPSSAKNHKQYKFIWEK